MAKANKAARDLRMAIDYLRAGDEAKAELGQRIRDWRESQALAQINLARALGVSTAFMCDVEYGRRHLSPRLLAMLEELMERNGRQRP